MAWRSNVAKRKAQGSEAPDDTFISIFSEVPDPRIERTKAHPLETVLFIALCGVICGADTFVGMAQFARAKREWLETVVEMPGGVPSHDTFGRVFAALDTRKLSEAFVKWTEAVAGQVSGVVAIDGKALRRSFRDGAKKSFVHMVSAWSATNRLVLGQVKTDDKSNEITAIPQLLDMLHLSGCLVTIDAMGCQRAIAQKIVDGGADYLLAVKGNQQALEKELSMVFEVALAEEGAADSLQTHEVAESGHGRKEVRRCDVLDVTGILLGEEKWAGLHTAVMVTSTRRMADKETTERRYYISSRQGLSAVDALDATRSHWGIENQCHWVLDVAFDEDQSRVRVGNAGANFAVLRHIALNLLKRATSRKVGIKNRRLIAAWDNDYLARVLVGQG